MLIVGVLFAVGALTQILQHGTGTDDPPARSRAELAASPGSRDEDLERRQQEVDAQLREAGGLPDVSATPPGRSASTAIVFKDDALLAH